MIKLVERLNTEYDVQNISSREAAEQALDRLTVSVLISSLFLVLDVKVKLVRLTCGKSISSHASYSAVFFFNVMD